MRRRVAFLSTLVALLLIFVLPASTVQAGNYTYTVKKNTCSAYGGDYGYGHLYYKIRLDEYGKSGANKFTFAAKVQHRNLGGTKWYTEYNFGTYSYTYPNNSASYWANRWWSYDPNDLGWHRFRVAVKVWHNGTLLASKVKYGKTC